MKSMADKLKESEPYNLFFTEISDLVETTKQPNSIQFKDLLCPSLGEIKSILFVTPALDIKWVMAQLQEMNLSDIPLTFIYNDGDAPVDKDILTEKTNIRIYDVQDAGYTNNGKMCIFLYKDNSIRIVVMSASLLDNHWQRYVNCVWISELCPTLSSHSATRMGQGITYFKDHLYSFLWSYETPILKEWLDRVEKANFDAIKASLVVSTPAEHIVDEKPLLCHALRVRQLLSTYCEVPISEHTSWPVVAQVTTIGAIGKSKRYWLNPVFLEALSSSSKYVSLSENFCPELKIIFPTTENVENSLYGADSAKRIRFYMQDITWMKDMLCIWKAKERTEVLPKMKSYFRISPCKTKLAWFFFTSGNLTKAAWGNPIQNRPCFSVPSGSYHIGVMFLPKFYGQVYFKISGTTNDGSGFKPFPLVYDIPLIPYSSDDEPAHYGEDYSKSSI